MPEYITKKQVIDLINRVIENWNWVTTGNDYATDMTQLKCLREYVRSITPADVAPVVHAENVANAHPSDEFKCSKCGTHLADYIELRKVDEADDFYIYEFTDWNCCPRCGARMDGEENG